MLLPGPEHLLSFASFAVRCFCRPVLAPNVCVANAPSFPERRIAVALVSQINFQLKSKSFSLHDDRGQTVRTASLPVLYCDQAPLSCCGQYVVDGVCVYVCTCTVSVGVTRDHLQLQTDTADTGSNKRKYKQISAIT